MDIFANSSFAEVDIFDSFPRISLDAEFFAQEKFVVCASDLTWVTVRHTKSKANIFPACLCEFVRARTQVWSFKLQNTAATKWTTIVSLYLSWKCQRCLRTQHRSVWVHNMIVGAHSFWAWYYIFYCFIMIIIELRESANGNNHFLLHVGPQGGNADRLSRWSIKRNSRKS